MRKKKKQINGFSLIETLIFTVIVTIALAIFNNVYLFILSKTPQTLEYNRMLDLTINCTERLKYNEYTKNQFSEESICHDLTNEKYTVTVIYKPSITAPVVKKIEVKDNFDKIGNVVLESFYDR